MNRQSGLFLFLAAMVIQPVCAQPAIPFIKAHSGRIRILDGDDLQDGSIEPRLKPDVYTYHRSLRSKRIVYYTDQDSISFLAAPGSRFDFAVILDGRDTCYQRFSYDNPKKVTYTRKGGARAADTIPFTLGPNNAIHISARINGSQPLDLIFDTGASLGVLGESGAKKGVALDPGGKNVFDLGNVIIGSSPAKYIDYHGGAKADGILGFNAFEDRVVEIDYEKSILVVRDTATPAPAGYAAVEMKWRGTAIFVPCMLANGSRSIDVLALFDTGSKFALSLTNESATINRLFDLPSAGSRTGKGANGVSIRSKTVMLARLTLAGLSLLNVPADLELTRQAGGLSFNILGNDVLKRFNVILDYKNGMIYLKKNKLAPGDYNLPFPLSLPVLICVAVLVLLVPLVILRVKKTATRRQTE